MNALLYTLIIANGIAWAAIGSGISWYLAGGCMTFAFYCN